jgi:predicted HTH transcriptional regulator
MHGRILCEDCYMDLLSPAKACDPWAVHSAKTFLKGSSQDLQLNPTQQKILEVLTKNGPTEPGKLLEMVGIKETDLERDLAALRHMEKIRGELRDGKKMICLW